MKIRKISYQSIKITVEETSFITDPFITEKAIGKFPKSEGDVILITEKEFIGNSEIIEAKKFAQIVPEVREKVVEISSPGDYEIGGAIVRRPLDRQFYIIDHKDIRVMYIGSLAKELTPSDIKNMGDVDVLILPVGGEGIGSRDDVIEDAISAIDPTYLVPVAYKEDGVKLAEGLEATYTLDDFIKRFGYTNVTRTKLFKVSSGVSVDSKSIEVIVLE